MAASEKTVQRQKEIVRRFAKEFLTIDACDDVFVSVENHAEVYFRVCIFPGEDALVIEYTENKAYAVCGIFGEDGDLFYLDELNEDEMFAAMVAEVRSAY